MEGKTLGQTSPESIRVLCESCCSLGNPNHIIIFIFLNVFQRRSPYLRLTPFHFHYNKQSKYKMMVTNSAKRKEPLPFSKRKWSLLFGASPPSADIMSHAIRTRHVFLLRWRRCGRPSHSNSKVIPILFPACNFLTDIFMRTYIHIIHEILTVKPESTISDIGFEQGTTQNDDTSITAAESIKRRIPSKVKNVIQATANSYAQLISKHIIIYGRVVAAFNLHVSVHFYFYIFIFLGNTKTTLAVFHFGSTYFICFFFFFFLFFSPITLCLTKKNFTSDAYKNTFPPLHSDLPRLLTGSPPNRSKDDTLLDNIFLTSAIISHLVS